MFSVLLSVLKYLQLPIRTTSTNILCKFIYSFAICSTCHIILKQCIYITLVVNCTRNRKQFLSVYNDCTAMLLKSVILTQISHTIIPEMLRKLQYIYLPNLKLLRGQSEPNSFV